MKILAIVVDILEFIDFLLSPMGWVASLAVALPWLCWILGIDRITSIYYLIIVIGYVIYMRRINLITRD